MLRPYPSIGCREQSRTVLRSWRTAFFGTMIFIDYGESVLLAYETSYYYAPEKHYYGWIELSVNEDGTLRLIQSAYDQDGDGIMIQRQTATPEPSGALLLLVGAELLTPQRRRMVR